ncbi:hypothetical protein Hypma_013364 [Hypsizygus marmoreus]|uniref:Uncharacterized protein n=1 Tax=Hypsizygus marmoreus TaxID=39966 RepID=A0A369JEA5_HYPMA|nr:hypothetical protein Hypma_013364 [Hypsizygus marmoreus]
MSSNVRPPSKERESSQVSGEDNSRESSHAFGEAREQFNTESEAILEILSHLRSVDVSTTTQDFAFANYLATIDAIQSHGVEANHRGEHAADGLEGNNGESGSGGISESSRTADNVAAEILGSIVAEAGSISSSKRNRDQFSDDESTSSEEELDSSREDGDAHHKKRNTGQVKQLIKLFQTAPLGFPSSEWDNIIKGNSVNLDVILSSLHHIGAPKENT